MNVNDTAAELRDEFKKNTTTSKEWRLNQLNKLKNWLDIEVETYNNSGKDQNENHLKENEISCIKKLIECSLSLIDFEKEVKVQNGNNNHQATAIAVIIARSVCPLKSWLFALINAITNGSCVLVQFELSQDYADFILFENLFKNYLDKVRSFRLF